MSSTSGKKRNFTCFIRTEEEDTVLYNLEKHVDWLIGQREQGARGMVHLQLMFGFKNPRSLSGVMRSLGLSSVQIVNDPDATLKYCTDITKRIPGSQIITFGKIPNFNRKINNDFLKELNEYKNTTDIMQAIEEHDPLFYILNEKKLASYYASKFDAGDPSKFKLQDFLMNAFTDFSKVIVLIGATGLGKTEFALSHFKHPLRIRDKEDWRRLTVKTDGVVLDDLNFQSWDALTFLKVSDLFKFNLCTSKFNYFICSL